MTHLAMSFVDIMGDFQAAERPQNLCSLASKHAGLKGGIILLNGWESPLETDQLDHVDHLLY